MSNTKSNTFVLEGNALSAEQEEFFNQHGFLHFKNFIHRSTVDLFIREVDRVQKELIAQNVDKVNGIPLRYGKDHDGEKMIQRLAFTSHFSPALKEFLKDPRFDALLPLLGTEDGRIGEDEKDGLVVNHYINSPYSEFKNLGWHTDSPRDLFLGSKILPMLNVGLHLDDCPFSNGGLRVLPGTQNQNIFSLLFKKKYFVDNRPDVREVGFDIDAGDLTIHDGRLWHRVQQSPHVGDRSRRRVMYIPIITGEYSPKHADSPTPFYHKLSGLIKPKKEKVTDQGVRRELQHPTPTYINS